VISVALKTHLEIRLGIYIYKASLLHRPDDYIGFTPSCPTHILQQNCAHDADDGSYAVFTASREQSFSKLKLVLSYLRASLINNKSGKVMWYSFDENRKRRNSKSLLYFDEIIDDFASIKVRKALFCFN